MGEERSFLVEGGQKRPSMGEEHSLLEVMGDPPAQYMLAEALNCHHTIALVL